MYAGSEQLKEAVAQSSRHISAQIKINGKWHNVVKSLTLNSGSSDIAPGAALSAYIDVKMVTDEIFGGMPVEVEIGILLNDGSTEYVPMGTFYAQKPEKEAGLTQFKAYDKMSLLEYPFTTTLTYPAKAAAVLSEACEQCGVEFDGTVDDVDILSAPAGYTCREVVGFIAGLCGKFAYIGRNGKLRFKWYENVDCTLSVSRTFSYLKGESDTYIEYVKCNVDKNTSYQSGTGNSGITFDCPYMTQKQLDIIYDRMKGTIYRSGNINFHGNPLLDIGDMVITNDLQGSYSMPVMKLVQTYTGGLNTTIEASGSVSSEGEFKGPTVKSLERVYEEFLLVNEVMANKLSAKEADILYLRADKQSVIEADIYNAVISQADIRYAKLDEFDAYEGRINKLETEALTSESAVIHDLTSKVNKTDTLIFGAASGTTIQTEFSNSVIAQLGNAQIKSAMIEEISAAKITGLDLNTTKFTVHSENGKSLWADNTIQISDGTRLRVQIGKDAEDDYNMYLWDKSGNLLFDAIGITEQGISRKIIRDDVVKDNANISASKLNIDSLFNVINNDGSHTLKSSKIYLDEQAQSLDVAFNAMTTTLNNLQTTQSSQGTQISAVQGQIESKVWQQDISTAVSELQVGGRNLLTKTDSEKICQIPESQYVHGFTGTTVIPVLGDTYTLSFWAKADEDGTTVSTFFYEPATTTYIQSSQGHTGTNVDGYCPFTLTTNWTKYWVTYKQSETTSIKRVICPRVWAQNKSGNVYIKHIKLEEGNKATDWTPAPEDVQNEITELSTKYTDVKQTTDGLSATVASHTTQISGKAENSDVIAVNDNVTALTADLSGFKTTVSSTYTTKTEFSNLEIGSRNLIRYDNVISHGAGAFDKSDLILSGTLVRYDSALNGGFRFDSANCYEPNADYVLSGYITVMSGTITNFRILNGGKIGQFISFDVDGVKYGNPLVAGFMEINNLLNDKKEHYFVLKYTTPATISEDTGIQYTYFQPNSNDSTVVQYKITKFNLQKGNKATDWTPAPEDVQQQVTETNTIATQTANKFNWLVASGTSATDFTLTDRMAELTAQTISLNGNVKVNGDMLVDGAITGDKLNMTEIFSRDITATNMNINGGSINISTDNPQNYIILHNTSSGTGSCVGTDTVNVQKEYWSSDGLVQFGSFIKPDGLYCYLDDYFDGGYENAPSIYGYNAKILGTLTTSYLTVNPQDTAHEGGQITLKGAGTHTDINIDSYYGDLRFFDQTSQPIIFNCTDKKITGGYSFDGGLNGTLVTSGLSLVVSGRAYIKSGGYYKVANMVFVQMIIHLNAGLNGNDCWNLYSGMPAPRNTYVALSGSLIETEIGVFNACINGDTLQIRPYNVLPAGYDIVISGIYLT